MAGAKNAQTGIVCNIAAALAGSAPRVPILKNQWFAEALYWEPCSTHPSRGGARPSALPCLLHCFCSPAPSRGFSCSSCTRSCSQGPLAPSHFHLGRPSCVKVPSLFLGGRISPVLGRALHGRVKWLLPTYFLRAATFPVCLHNSVSCLLWWLTLSESSPEGSRSPDKGQRHRTPFPSAARYCTNPARSEPLRGPSARPSQTLLVPPFCP